MTDPTDRPTRGVSPDWTVPITSWRDDVARSRERIARLTQRETATSGSELQFEIIQELGATVEELSVAEEELRVQSEQLERAYSDLERDRMRYRALFHRAPVPYIVTDAVGAIIDANAAAIAMLGVRPEHLIRRPLSVFLHDASRPRLRRLISQCREPNGRPRTLAFDIIPRGGEMLRVEATVSSSENLETARVEIAWLLVDQTQRIEREETERRRAAELEALVLARTAELRRAQQLKDQLIGTVSHEFRTALGAIGGYAEMLTLGIHGALTEEQAGDIERIQRAYAHLARLVDDLLSYNKLSAGQVSLELEDVSLADALRGIRDLITPQATARSIVIDDGTADAQVIVRADPERVRQIVLNLLGNAVKFSARGTTVRLCARVRDDLAIVEVIDAGPGIPADKLDVIFEPFVRLGADAEVTGSGLGLAISREIARAMRGELKVTSEVGRGTCFTLELPVSTPLAATG